MIRFLYKLKLSLKILSLISVILIISLVLINIFFIETYYSTILSKDEDKAIEIAKMFAQLSSNALHRQDYYTLESNVKHIQNNSDI